MMRLSIWWYVSGTILVLLVALSAIAVRTARDRLIQRGYEARFLTPDIEAYPWERRGEHPEAITWTPEGIVFDPPSGSTAYVAVAARGTYGRLGSLPGFAIGPLGRLLAPTPYTLTSVEVEAVVRLQNAYFMIVEWGATTVQATPNGMLLTMIEPGLVHTNIPLQVNSSVRQSIRLLRSSQGTWVLVESHSICRNTISHNNDGNIWIGESRKNSEHGGIMLLSQLVLK